MRGRRAHSNTGMRSDAGCGVSSVSSMAEPRQSQRAYSAKRASNQKRKRDARLEAIRVVIENRERIGDMMLLRAMLNAVIRRHRLVEWTTPAAAALGEEASGHDRQVDHVVPVQILIDRLIAGEDPDVLMSASTCCYVTHEEHHSEGVLGKFRRDHPDLRSSMQTCSIEELRDVGWERYRRAGLTWSAVAPTMAEPPDSLELDFEDESDDG